MGSPRKEKFVRKYMDEMNVPFVMGVGGSFDVVAGKVSRAPQWMQNAGMEWSYRLLQEPGRMWKRYLVTNTRFGIELMNRMITSRLGMANG
jgi:N-acetylglucosaminyldiphosphoundecaprenol N-acetyl-beta-D-mannosaminyltransferase